MNRCKYRFITLHAVLLGCAIGGATQSASAGPVTQTVNASDYNDTAPGNATDLGDAVLARGTAAITALTTTSTLVDQGWGGSAYTNGIEMVLLDNGTWLWNQFVAGAQHSWTTQTYDITQDSAALNGLDTALAGIDWSTGPTVSLSMYANGWGYPGWALYAQDNAFTVTSDAALPEPASLAMFGAALAMLGYAAWRGNARSL
jgi:hypothetical protein